jgi:replicative DNA helicase
MIEKEEVTLASFGKPFQEKLAQLILDDAHFGDQIGEVLKTDFFEFKYLREFVSLIYSYKEQYKKYPSRETIETILRTELEGLNSAAQKQVKDFYVRIASQHIGNVNEEYVKEKSLDFCRKQTLKEAMFKSVELMENSSFDEVQKVINNALKLGSDNEHGYEFIKHFEERYQLIARNPVSTGWKVIDSYTDGGIGKGELGVCIAPTGAGKSMALVHLGARALQQGKNVVYYTLELKDTVVGLRFDSCLTGFSLKGLHGLKDEVYEKVKDVQGSLIIKEYPTKTASTSTIRNHLNRLKQRGFEPDLVIVDYGDLLRPNRTEKEKRNELESIYEELRGIAGEFECPVWTASQTNRSGLNAEVITMESISEAFNKCFVADFIFSLSRTIADKQNNSGRVFIAKNRNGPDGIVCPIFMDTSSVSIDVMEPTDESIEDIKKNLAKAQSERLKEKYKKHKEEQKKGGE